MMHNFLTGQSPVSILQRGFSAQGSSQLMDDPQTPRVMPALKLELCVVDYNSS